jgi:hypothetical protein
VAHGAKDMRANSNSGRQTELPDHVYLITVDGEWPVTAVAADHPSLPDRIERAVQSRVANGPQRDIRKVHVWRVPVMQATEVELVPAKVLPASISEIGPTRTKPQGRPTEQ